MKVLKLCIAAYLLPRTIGVDGVYTCLMLATRGIVAGSVTATIELRALLIEFLDDTSRLFPRAILSVYVDDTGVEAMGPPAAVVQTVVGAAQHVTAALSAIGMEWSHTKNVVNASSSALASQVASALPLLDLLESRRTKSLGGALGAGKVRNTQVQRSRMADFAKRIKTFSGFCGARSVPHVPIWCCGLEVLRAWFMDKPIQVSPMLPSLRRDVPWRR